MRDLMAVYGMEMREVHINIHHTLLYMYIPYTTSLGEARFHESAVLGCYCIRIHTHTHARAHTHTHTNIYVMQGERELKVGQFVLSNCR